MIILDATTKSLEFLLGGTVTTNQLPFTSMVVDHTSTTYTPVEQDGVSNNTTAVTIVSAPGASTQRSVKFINIRNRDTVAATVTIQYNNNATIRQMLQVTLAANDTLEYLDTDGWSVIDTNGQKKSLASVTGTVTANAGTNLNTSALALETTQSTQNTRIGDLTETAPGTDTASSGLNGRLQRVAQRLTSLIALLPSALVSGRLDVNLGAAPVTITSQGDVAHDAVDSGNPLKIGLQARTTDPSVVANADRVNGISDTLGKQIVLVGSNHDRKVVGNTTRTNTTAADVIAAQGAGVRTVVTNILVTNAHVSVNTKVEIRDGTTVRVLGFARSDGGGYALHNPSGLFISTANTAVTARCVTTGADVDINIQGYTISN